MSEYTFHPACDFLPSMLPSEYQDLMKSVREVGLLEPIELLDTKETGGANVILDGRHRYKACREAGVAFRCVYRSFGGDESAILRYVIQKNIERRHLTPSQKAMLAADAIECYEEAARKRREAGLKQNASDSANLRQRDKGKSAEKAADSSGAGSRSVESALAVKQRGIAPLADTVRSGKVPVSVAEKVARLPEPAQQQFVETVKVSAKPPHQVAEALRRDRKREEIVHAAKTLQPLESIGTRFPVLVADPPWQFPQKMGHTNRSVENHYPTMDLEAICALPIPKICTPDAILFLWVTAPMAEFAFEVVRAWQFRYVSQFVWIKPHQATGYHTFNRHELVYICRRGEIPLQERENTFDSVMETPPRENTHSSKPVTLQERIEVMYGEYPKIELFSRCPRKGWAAWGFEAVPPDRSGVDAFFEETTL